MYRLPWKAKPATVDPTKWVVVDADGKAVAEAEWVATDLHHGYNLLPEKHARLFAAAPELLASLKDLVRDVRYLVDEATLPISALQHPSMVAAMEAIEKAESDEYIEEEMGVAICNVSAIRKLDLTSDSSDIQEVMNAVATLGIRDEDLDDLVHEFASMVGSTVNNSGMEEQVRFLINEMGKQGLIDHLHEITETEKSYEEQ